MKIEQFLVVIKHGVDWGPKPLEVVWRSEDGRFAIVTQAGRSVWSGRGSRTYQPKTTMVIDLQRAGQNRGYSLYLACKIHEVEGRVNATDIKQLARVYCEAKVSKKNG